GNENIFYTAILQLSQHVKEAG
ncbi:hypothetical protein MNBD_GAMMA24-2707, partial [hydrothermal vent metagenome]